MEFFKFMCLCVCVCETQDQPAITLILTYRERYSNVRVIYSVNSTSAVIANSDNFRLEVVLYR